jgi:hypothetical protein
LPSCYADKKTHVFIAKDDEKRQDTIAAAVDAPVPAVMHFNALPGKLSYLTVGVLRKHTPAVAIATAAATFISLN